VLENNIAGVRKMLVEPQAGRHPRSKLASVGTIINESGGSPKFLQFCCWVM
jgi:hypothetical protein